MGQLLNVILPSVLTCIVSGLLIKISLSFAKQTWSNNFQYTLICLLLPIITFVVTKVISNNIALSLGMVGALSIVRFRNPVKNSLELVIYFALIAIGIASGVNSYYAILLGILISILIISLYFIVVILKRKNIDYFSFSHNVDNHPYSVELETVGEINISLYQKNLQHYHFNKERQVYYYRFISENKNEIQKIYQSFKSLDSLKSIDVKYE
tara:strand:+ start:131 stop:763 length:633 start_codon:yes stop_codon:yes gene_type:complete